MRLLRTHACSLFILFNLAAARGQWGSRRHGCGVTCSACSFSLSLFLFYAGNQQHLLQKGCCAAGTKPPVALSQLCCWDPEWFRGSAYVVG